MSLEHTAQLDALKADNARLQGELVAATLEIDRMALLLASQTRDVP